MHSLGIIVIFLLFFYANAQLPPETTTNPEDCPYQTFPSQSQFYKGQNCFYLSVPENYNNPEGKKIQIPVLVIESQNTNHQAASVYLEGGPGMGSSPIISLFLSSPEFLNSFLEHGDIILFDQRGTGYSKPNLACPDETLNFDYWNIINIDSIRVCMEYFINEGVDLKSYSSQESAKDINSIRKQLGYEQLNLIGTSYGTFLAQQFMKDFPNQTRSVILDSPVPFGNNFSTPEVFAEAAATIYQNLFDLCLNDFVCNQKYPNLEKEFVDLLESLEQTPLEIKSLKSISPIQVTRLSLSPELLLSLILTPTTSASLFKAIAQRQLTSPELQLSLQAITSFLQPNSPNFGSAMHISVVCNDFHHLPEISSPSSMNPNIIDYYRKASLGFDRSAICDFWPKKSSQQSTDITNEIPTIILVGSLDPITPPYWGKEITKTIEQAKLIEFPSAFHGVILTGPCVQSIMANFIKAPHNQPDENCVSEKEFKIDNSGFDLEVTYFGIPVFETLNTYTLNENTHLWNDWSIGLKAKYSSVLLAQDTLSPSLSFGPNPANQWYEFGAKYILPITIPNYPNQTNIWLDGNTTVLRNQDWISSQATSLNHTSRETEFDLGIEQVISPSFSQDLTLGVSANYLIHEDFAHDDSDQALFPETSNTTLLNLNASYVVPDFRYFQSRHTELTGDIRYGVGSQSETELSWLNAQIGLKHLQGFGWDKKGSFGLGEAREFVFATKFNAGISTGTSPSWEQFSLNNPRSKNFTLRGNYPKNLLRGEQFYSASVELRSKGFEFNNILVTSPYIFADTGNAWGGDYVFRDASLHSDILDGNQYAYGLGINTVLDLPIIPTPVVDLHYSFTPLYPSGTLTASFGTGFNF